MELKNVKSESFETKIFMHYIDPVFKPDPSKPFKKQEFCVRIIDSLNGSDFENKMVFQVLGDDTKPQDDDTKLLDGLVPGDRVDIVYNIKSFPKKDMNKPPTALNPESLKGFNNLTAKKITLFEKTGNVSNVNLNDKKAQWDKMQLELKDKNVPHENMKWSEEKGMWIDDLPF